MITSAEISNIRFSGPDSKVVSTLQEYESREASATGASPNPRTDTTAIPVVTDEPAQASRLLQLATETAERYSNETRQAADRYVVEQRAAAEQEVQRIVAQAQASAQAEYTAQLRMHLKAQLDALDEPAPATMVSSSSAVDPATRFPLPPGETS
jgi:cell division septum initiation protein DivIVA